MRNLVFAAQFAALLLAFSPQGVHAADAAFELQQARQFLTGDHKNPGAAKKLLLDVVATTNAGENPDSFFWACIYLGYVEDRAGNRDAAIGWYTKAAVIDGMPTFATELAARGLKQPLVWIRHLDGDEASPAQAAAPPLKPAAQPNRRGLAYLAKDPPELALASNLSAEERLRNFQSLWSLVDANYADFDLKSIDWTAVGVRYLNRLSSVAGDDDFYLMMFQFVNELKDTHSWLNNYKPPLLSTARDMPTDLFADRPYVIAGDKAGWEVLAVDGMSFPERVEWMRPYLHASSSERRFRREAARALLAGKTPDPVSVTLRSPQGEAQTLTLKRGGRSIPFVAPHLSIALTSQQFVDFGRYPSGLGYIRIRSFNGREEIAKEFDRALDALRDTRGLILDVRDNPGGFGHDEIVGRFLNKTTFVGYSHTKSGPKHNQLEKQKNFIEPRGWKYQEPVALLVNDGTGSAADLFTRDMHAAPHVTIIGTTTHGNLSGEAVYAVLPCGLVVRISNGYLSDTKDRSIEVNGNVPDITVEPSIDDCLAGRDPVLDRASEFLLAGGQRSPNSGR
jgi:carboxyl-terminal processing protease